MILKEILSFMWCKGDFAVIFSDFRNFSFSTSEIPSILGSYLLGISMSFFLMFPKIPSFKKALLVGREWNSAVL